MAQIAPTMSNSRERYILWGAVCGVESTAVVFLAYQTGLLEKVNSAPHAYSTREFERDFPDRTIVPSNTLEKLFQCRVLDKVAYDKFKATFISHKLCEENIQSWLQARMSNAASFFRCAFKFLDNEMETLAATTTTTIGGDSETGGVDSENGGNPGDVGEVERSTSSDGGP